MIICRFEDGGEAKLRHAVTHALVEQEGKILLVKRSGNILESGKWALPGGYVNLNETIMDGALRELYEETEWKGEIITIFRINSRTFIRNEDRQNVRIEFLIKPVEQVGGLDHEVSEIGWFSEADLPPLEQFAFDHRDSVLLYLKYLKNPFPLPIVE